MPVLLLALFQMQSKPFVDSQASISRFIVVEAIIEKLSCFVEWILNFEIRAFLAPW